MTGVRLSASLEAAVIDWAKQHTDEPNKAEAIRRLVELAPLREQNSVKRER
jgi:hypothetical protein